MRIGIDLGGTKIEGVLMAADGWLLHRRRVPTPKMDYDATLRAIAALVAALRAQDPEPVTRIGIGMPGSLNPATGLVQNANSTWLIGQPIDHDLTGLLGQPLRLANDADCFALSEAVDGAGAGFGTVFGVILGTGCGGGLVVHGRLLKGPHAIAGEWGHNPLPWPQPEELPGPSCYCGKSGCLETWLSGPGLAVDHRRVRGQDLSAERIAAGAAAGDAACLASLERHRDRLARGLASVINLFDPDCIVLGGGLSNLPGLVDTLPDLIARYSFSDRCATAIRLPIHGDSSGVRGAAWLWPPPDPAQAP